MAQSRLLNAAQIQHYQAGIMQARPGAVSDPGGISQWLVEQNALSAYQVKVLLAGKSGPFFFGDYRVYDRIDNGRLKGGFRAVHQPTGHPVILEFLTGPAAQGAAWSESVRRVHSAADAPHANLARPHEAVDLTTHKFMVLEDLRGQTLRERLEAGPLSIPEACALVRQAAMGAMHLHGLKTAHGDIRPDNVWHTSDGHVKLMHSPLENLAALTPERADYAAPELANPGAVPTLATDVYAVGSTLYQAIVGKPPFEGGDIGAKMRRQATEAIQPLENFGVPKPLADAVMYMMAKNVGVRTPSMQQVIDQLAAYMGASTQTPPQTAPSFEAYSAHLRQKRESGPAIQAASDAAAAATLAASNAAQASNTGPKITIATDESDGATLAEKRTAAAKKGLPLGWIAGGVGAAGVLIAILVIALGGPGDDEVTQNGDSETQVAPPDGNGSSSTNPDGATGNGESTNGGADGPGDTETATVDLTPDDGKTLWVSPTSGESISFERLPPGGQVFVVLRPADLLGSSIGAETLKVLDEAIGKQAARGQWEDRAGVKLDAIDQLIISLHGNDGRFPRMNYMVKLKEAKPVADLVTAWGAAKVEGENGDYYKKGLYCYYPKDDGSLFLMGAEEDVKECVAQGGAAPAIRRDVEQLRKVSDSGRHLTIMFSPKFFSGDGLPLCEGDTERARDPLDWLLGDSLQAGLISFHFGDDAAYGEMRFVSDARTDSRQLAKQLQRRLAEIPDQMKEYVSFKVDPPDYWRRIAFALPDMVELLHEQTRVEAEDSHAVLNFYLPPKAAPNLTFGGAMLMLSAPSRRAVAAVPKPAGPKNFQELLDKPASMFFEQQSLEFAMRDITIDINEANPGLPFSFSIKIDGGDLELDGITRNQQVVGFEAENLPLSQMLTKLVMKANPITTVKEPVEEDQKLVWIITDDPEKAGQKMILITTRKAVAKKNYTLPKVFVP